MGMRHSRRQVEVVFEVTLLLTWCIARDQTCWKMFGRKEDCSIRRGRHCKQTVCWELSCRQWWFIKWKWNWYKHRLLPSWFILCQFEELTGLIRYLHFSVASMGLRTLQDCNTEDDNTRTFNHPTSAVVFRIRNTKPCLLSDTSCRSMLNCIKIEVWVVECIFHSNAEIPPHLQRGLWKKLCVYWCAGSHES